MASDVKEVFQGQRSSKTKTGQQYTRIFIVTLASLGTSPARSARLEAGVPDIGDAHPDDASAKVTKVDVRGTASRLIWNVYVEYQTPSGSWPSPEPDPTDEDPQIRWGAWSRTIAVEKDKDGLAIENSAGQLFDPPVEDEEYHLQLTVVRNQAAYNPLTAAGYYGAVNDDTETFCGLTVSARKAKCVQWSAEEAEQNGISYYIVTYILLFNLNTWDLEILDQGMNYLDGGKLTHCKIRKESGELENADTPQNLDGSGNQLAVGAAKAFVTYRRAQEKDFSTLNLNI